MDRRSREDRRFRRRRGRRHSLQGLRQQGRHAPSSFRRRSPLRADLRETHSRFDPVATLPFFDVEQIVSIPDLVPYDEFRDGRFFQEWMRPQGLVDAANSVLEKSASSCSFLTILRNEACGIVDDEMRRRMTLIVPHVRRAVLIGKAIDLKEAEAAIFADMLDGLSAGLFLIAADGRIVHANAAGHDMLSAGDCLRSTSRTAGRPRHAGRQDPARDLCGRRRRRRRNRRQGHCAAADGARRRALRRPRAAPDLGRATSRRHRLHGDRRGVRAQSDDGYRRRPKSSAERTT